MFYYEIHVEIPKYGYSFAVCTEIELTDNEIIQQALNEKKFDDEGDQYCVDGIETITIEQYDNYML